MFNFLTKREKTKRKKKGEKTQEKKFYFEFNNSSQIDYFIENLGILVSSGMPIIDALRSIVKEISSPKLKYLINKIIEEIGNGSTIWKALERSKLFKEHTLSLVKMGEESGKLVQNLKVLTTEEQKTKSLKSKMKAAMMYPGFVMVVMAVVGIGISWLILPKLATVFSQLRLELPLVTKLLIDLGKFLGEYGIYVVPLFIIVLIVIFYFLFIYRKTKHIGQKILYVLPGIGRLMKEVEIARFGYLLGTLLQAGIPINTALSSLEGITELLKYRKLYEHLNISIYEGNTFNKAFDSYSNMKNLIPAPIQQLIVAGEQSGKLDQTLLRIGEMYSEKSDITTKNLTSILEPILLVIVWLGVISIALAVILPIYGLVGGLNAG